MKMMVMKIRKKLVSDKMDEPSVELIESTEVETMQEIADEV